MHQQSHVLRELSRPFRFLCKSSFDRFRAGGFARIDLGETQDGVHRELHERRPLAEEVRSFKVLDHVLECRSL